MTGSRNSQDTADAQYDAIVEEATGWFVRMTSDAVSDADQRAFRAWLDRDPTHRKAYAEVQSLWNALGDISDPRLDVETSSSDERAESEIKAPFWCQRPLQQATGVAASLLVAAFLGLWAVGGIDGLRADHATAVGETRDVTLADGSVVQLNTDTGLIVDFGPDCRCVEILRGEAFFTVAPEPGRPFRVAADGWTAEALGTAFSVRQTGGSVAVVVTESRVRVSVDRAGVLSGGETTLSAGEAVRFDPDHGTETGAADVASLTAWREGRLVFVDKRLRSVVAELDRYRPGTIRFLNAGIANERLTGAFRLDDTDHALAAIEAALPVDVIRVTPWLTLLRARN